VHFEQRADRQVADTAKRDRRRHNIKDDQAGTPHPRTVLPLAVLGWQGDSVTADLRAFERSDRHLERYEIARYTR